MKLKRERTFNARYMLVHDYVKSNQLVKKWHTLVNSARNLKIVERGVVKWVSFFKLEVNLHGKLNFNWDILHCRLNKVIARLGRLGNDPDGYVLRARRRLVVDTLLS